MSFKAGSQQYSALLGTENGVGVAYLLAKHQTTLGWKVVDSIEVFYDQGFAYIVFNIRDAVPKSDKTEAAGPSRGLSRRAGRYGNTRVSLRAAKDLGAENVQKLKNAGMAANSTHTSVNDLVANGYTLEESYSLRADRVTMGSEAVARILPPIAGPPPQMAFRRWKHTSRMPGQPRAHRTEYTGAHHPKMILSLSQNSKIKERPPPALTGWADMNYLARLQALGANSMSSLQHIVYCGAENRKTFTNLGEMLQGQEVDFDHRKLWTEGSREYDMLLGLVPGQEIVDLLITHRDALGMKKVKSISVWYEDHGGAKTPIIWYELQDVQGGPGQSQNVESVPNPPGWRDASGYAPAQPVAGPSNSGRSRRTLRSPSGSGSGSGTISIKRSASTNLDEILVNSQLDKRWPLVWNMNIVAAEKLGERNALDLIDASTLKASPSRWTEVGNLGAGRFELTESGSDRTDRLPVASGAVAKIVPALVHMPAPQVMYRVWSQRINPRRSLSALHHTNFLLSTAKKLKVLGPAQESLIAWHDVAYLSRLQAVGEEQMGSLKHIIKADTDNPNALQIVAEMLGNWTPEFTARRTYAECTKEFNILLGIMPGQEVTEFLLTHRAALGMRKVRQISVWYEQNGVQTFPVFWYELQDVQEGVAQLQYLRPPIAGPSNSGPSRLGSANPPGWRDASGYRPQ